jgi:trehalose 6-phosphate phosphatase
VTLPVALRPFARHPNESAFVTDFDGTLAPIVDDPLAADALPQSIHALRTLVAHLGLVAIVSGRPLTFLRERVSIDGLELIGQYGLERLIDGEAVLDPRAVEVADAIAAATADARQRWPNLVLERKGDIAFTVHWRTAPEAAPDGGELAALAARHGLWTQRGRMACELRPPIPVDKGVAYDELTRGFRHRAFVGDDDGDLAAFAIGRDEDEGRTVRVAVRSPEVPPGLLVQADLVVEGPEGLAQLLTELADAVSSGEQQ